jgi:hypothetical protein
MKAGIALLTLAFLLRPCVGRADDLGPEDKGTPAVVTGWLRDAACLMHYKKVTKPLNECAKMCAEVGSPLVVATPDGKLYTPISETIPETDQRKLLLEHVGKYVRVSGRLFERSGMRAISVEKIEDVAEP